MKFSRLYKVKEGKLDTLKDWFAVLGGDRRDEAMATFAYENVAREVFVLFSGHDGGQYVVGLNEVTGELKKGDQTVAINQEHTKILKDCLEPVSEGGEVLLDLCL